MIKDIDVAFTEFAGAETLQGNSYTLSWQDFANQLFETGHTVEESKSTTPLILPVRFKEGSNRKVRQNIECVTMGALDFDNLTQEQLELLATRILAEEVDCIIYSTWGHLEAQKKGLFKLRLVVALSRPVDIEEWDFFWYSLNTKFGGLADGQCKDPSRGYFLPAIADGISEEDRESLIFSRQEGKPLDVDHMLSSYDSLTADDFADYEDADREDLSEERLKKFAKRMSKSSEEYKSWMGDLLGKVLKGEEFAEEGHRDTTVFKLAQDIGKQFPAASSQSIARVFARSLRLMGLGAPTMEDVALKVQRAQRAVQVERFQKKRKELVVAQSRKRLLKVTAYDRKCIEAFVEVTGCGCTFDLFTQRLIVQSKNNYYVFNGTGYNGPCLATELPLACRDLLPPAFDTMGVNLCIESEKSVTAKNAMQLVQEYGVWAHGGVWAGHGPAYYDEKTCSFKESWHNIREDLEPQECPELDAWIDAICSTPEQAEGLRDWLTAVTDLSRPLVMLVLIGRSGLGKSSFAHGVSRIWDRGGAGDMGQMFNSFNSLVRGTPVLLADEGLPEDGRGRVPTDKLRSLITSNKHVINGKHQAPMEYIGHFRTVAAVNNKDKITLGRVTSQMDAEAIAKRLFTIEMKEGQSFNYKLFVEQDAIAKHCLWLRENREQRLDRFAVSDSQTDQVSDVVMQTEAAQTIMSWCMWFFSNRKIEEEMPPPAFVAKGDLYISYAGMSKYWEQCFNNNKNIPSMKKLVEWISMCAVRYYKTISRNGKPGKYWVVHRDMLEKHVLELDGTLLDLKRQLAIHTEWSHYPHQFLPTSDEETARETARNLEDGEEEQVTEVLEINAEDDPNDEDYEDDDDDRFPDPEFF